MNILPPRFNVADAERAHDVWGCNCGPGALAAITRLTLDEVRRHMGDFERKGYTNPTLMFSALKSVDAKWESIPEFRWPTLRGLCRVQWEGPWTAPGSNPRWAYRHTHWIGVARSPIDGTVGIFDINCMNNGSGWVAFEDWRNVVVPYILKECVPRANGKWHITHAIEVDVPKASEAVA